MILAKLNLLFTVQILWRLILVLRAIVERADRGPDIVAGAEFLFLAIDSIHRPRGRVALPRV